MTRPDHKKSFGAALKECRKQAGLSLEKFAAALEAASDNQLVYSYEAIRNWENGTEIPASDRRRLCCIIKVFCLHGVMRTRQDANAFLALGFYLHLGEEETMEISEAWYEELVNRRGDQANVALVFSEAVARWLQNPQPVTRLLLGGTVNALQPQVNQYVLKRLGAMLRRWTPGRFLAQLLWFALWLAIWQLAVPLHYWPLQTPVQTGLLYTLATLLIPAAAATLDWQRQRHHWQQVSGGRPGLRWLVTWAGALIGYQLGLALVLAFSIVARDLLRFNLLADPPLPALLLALLVALLAFFGARAVPRNVWNRNLNLRLRPADGIILLTFLLLGPVVALVVGAVNRLLVATPLAGTGVLLLIGGLIAGLTVLQRHLTGSYMLPVSRWALVIGVLWVLYVFAAWPREMAYAVAGSLALAVAILILLERRM